MLELLADVLSLIVEPCYALTGNWWASIALFTVITKVILMPMALWVQKNCIVMVQLMPDLNRLKAKYFGDAETIGEKQNALYKEKRYHPLLSLVPLAVQILILFGLVEVIHGITDNGAPGTELLGLVPVEDGGLSWAMPALAGLSAVAMGFAQNRINPLQREQSRAEKNMTNGLSIALSFFLGMFVAAGMAFYWICSNLTAIVVQAVCNAVIKPSKHIDYADLADSRVALDEMNALSADRPKWWRHDPLTKREKADYKRFFNIVNKHIVFVAESSGFFKYYQGAIEWLLANSDAHIHYITSDPNDRIFERAKAEPRILPYFIGEKRLITLMMKMDADVVVTTQEDLENYYIKRSYIKKDAEYVFMFHHMTSTHLTALKNSYDHYDALLCVGPHQIDEIRRAEGLYGLPAKELIPCGYDLLDREVAAYEGRAAQGKAVTAASGGSAPAVPGDSAGGAVGEAKAAAAADPASAAAGAGCPVVLIAPSWQEDNLLDLCFDELVGALLGRGWRIVVRPHPEYTKRYRPRWEAIQARWAHVPSGELSFERDFSSNETIFTSDVLITDWSSITCEFSFSTLRPSVFIDTPMKVGNPDWRELGMEPTDISLRDEIGVSIAPADVAGRAAGVVADMIDNSDKWNERIREVREGFVFNLGHGGEVAGEYLLGRILAKQEGRKGEVRHAE